MIFTEIVTLAFYLIGPYILPAIGIILVIRGVKGIWEA